MRLYFLKFMYFLGFCLLLATLACGKVTQVSNEEEEILSHSISADINVYSTKDIELLIKDNKDFKASSYFSVLDTTVFTQLVGIKKNGRFVELSWGKSILSIDKTPVKTEESEKEPASESKDTTPSEDINTKTQSSSSAVKQKKRYLSSSYKKDGTKLSQANYEWAKISFNNEKKIWDIETTKIESGYAAYLIKFLAGKDKYRFRIIEEHEVSGNKTVALQNISMYHTFLAALYLQDLEDNNGLVKDTISISRLSNIFNLEFFNELNFQLPGNNVKKFKPEKPVFILRDHLNIELSKILKFLASDDKSECIKYIKKNKAALLSKKACGILINNIESIK
ncbi:MAG: hypothetical protein GY730_07560 [bacterium]|nr:hypothetical protein [bacterium]